MHSIDHDDGLTMRPARKSPLLDKAAVAAPSGETRETHVAPFSPRREEAEAFIRQVFREHYGAHVRSFAPDLLLVEAEQRVIGAAGWRGGNSKPLFLERYLDEPVEDLLARRTGLKLPRERLVEVGHLASDKPGTSVHIILALARHLSAAGYEWVVFTATSHLVRIFTRLGLPLLALANADPARLGAEAGDWGSYYDTRPVVVAGRIRIALDRVGMIP